MNSKHVLKLSLLFGGVRRQLPNNIEQKYRNQNECSSNLSESIYTPKIHYSSSLPSISTVANKNRIPSNKLTVNIENSVIVVGSLIFAPITGAINQAAEILMQRPDRARNQGLEMVITTSSLSAITGNLQMEFHG